MVASSPVRKWNPPSVPGAPEALHVGRLLGRRQPRGLPGVEADRQHVELLARIEGEHPQRAHQVGQHLRAQHRALEVDQREHERPLAVIVAKMDGVAVVVLEGEIRRHLRVQLLVEADVAQQRGALGGRVQRTRRDRSGPGLRKGHGRRRQHRHCGKQARAQGAPAVSAAHPPHHLPARRHLHPRHVCCLSSLNLPRRPTRLGTHRAGGGHPIGWGTVPGRATTPVRPYRGDAAAGAASAGGAVDAGAAGIAGSPRWAINSMARATGMRTTPVS